ncbi:SPOSA6832_04540, partial [Sporobolomyces salmonicolor]
MWRGRRAVCALRWRNHELIERFQGMREAKSSGDVLGCAYQEEEAQGPARFGVDPTQELDNRRRSALEELQLFRQTLDSLKARLPGLEYFVANSSLKDDDSPEMDAVVKSFGDPVTELSGVRSGNGETPTRPARVPVAWPGQHSRKKLKEEVEAKRETDESEVNVQAAIDLEFNALGRPRVWNESNVRTAQNPDLDESVRPPPLLVPFSRPAGPDLRQLLQQGSTSPTHRLAILAPHPVPESPVSLYPDSASLLAAAPTALEEDVVFRQGLERYGWHHSVIHSPFFFAQLAAFRDLGYERFERCSLGWLSSYFALLAVSTKLVGPAEQAELGWSEEETSRAACRWFQTSFSATSVRSTFSRSFVFTTDAASSLVACLQAIALLVLSGRDAGSATLIASLLSSGLSIAQDLGLHRLVTDEQWTASMEGKPLRHRAKALVERELQKRVLWALVHSEWFAIPFKGYSLLAKLQIETPLPLNATNEYVQLSHFSLHPKQADLPLHRDLATGDVVNRHRDEYTCVSWLLQYIDIGSSMATAFESNGPAKATASQAYQAFLEADRQLEAILTNLPAWLRPGGDTTGMPDLVDTMRSTFLISLQHKILSIHRPFLAKPSRATTYSFSHRRVVDAARAILREATRVQGVRIWTVLYQCVRSLSTKYGASKTDLHLSLSSSISVASFSMSLELFEQLKHPSPENEAIRDEIFQALPTLDGLKQASSIAERGLGLVLPLLADEKRLKTEMVDKKKKRKSKSSQPPVPSTSKDASPRPGPSSSSALFPSYPSSTFDNPLPPSYRPDLPSLPVDSPSASGAFFPAASASPDLSSHLPAFPSPYDPSAPAWLYSEQFLYSHLSGLDGPGGGGAGVGAVPPGPGMFAWAGMPPPPEMAIALGWAGWPLQGGGRSPGNGEAPEQ